MQLDRKAHELLVFWYCDSYCDCQVSMFGGVVRYAKVWSVTSASIQILFAGFTMDPMSMQTAGIVLNSEILLFPNFSTERKLMTLNFNLIKMQVSYQMKTEA